MKKVLIKDIVIPAGTVFDSAPFKTERPGDGHIQAIIGFSKDSSGSIEYCLDDMDNEKEYFVDLKE